MATENFQYARHSPIEPTIVRPGEKLSTWSFSEGSKTLFSDLFLQI